MKMTFTDPAMTEDVSRAGSIQRRFTVLQSNLHTGGGLREAFAESRRLGCPIQHLTPAGNVVVCWHEDGKRRQRTKRNVRIVPDILAETCGWMRDLADESMMDVLNECKFDSWRANGNA